MPSAPVPPEADQRTGILSPHQYLSPPDGEDSTTEGTGTITAGVANDQLNALASLLPGAERSFTTGERLHV
jgi:hypothetical protein